MLAKKSCATTRVLIGLCLLAQSTQALAAPRQNIFEREKLNTLYLSEFIYGDEVEQKLMPVFLLGEVAKPGIYHVPVKTDLTTLLSIAGGPTSDSSVNEILIKNQDTNRREEVDFENVIAGQNQRSPVLQVKDVVYVPMKKPLISSNTMTTLSVVATIAAIAITGLYIRRELR